MFKEKEGGLPRGGYNEQCSAPEQSQVGGRGEHITWSILIYREQWLHSSSPLTFDIKDIKELFSDSDKPFQRVQTFRQITYLWLIDYTSAPGLTHVS